MIMEEIYRYRREKDFMGRNSRMKRKKDAGERGRTV